MNRRQFIGLIGGTLAAWPFSARAQQSAMPVIGVLALTAPAKEPQYDAVFRQGLGESGFVEGKNVAIEYRWVDDRYDLLPAMLTDLVRQRVSVLVASTDPAAIAAKTIGLSIPIVFIVGGDPVQMGLVTSMNRPGANFTGTTVLNAGLLPKRLEFLHEVSPAATNFAALVNPANPNADTLSKAMLAAASTLGLQLHILSASTESDFEKVFATVAELRCGGLLIGGDPFFIGRDQQLGALTLRYAVPAITQYRDFAKGGGLMSYGGIRADVYRQAGVYAGRVLKGEKPADLPVFQATKVELVINLKTAKALGLTIPPTLLARADEVIE
jgi:putative tryptophan/tyrosine transport system substrate-binding protein